MKGTLEILFIKRWQMKENVNLIFPQYPSLYNPKISLSMQWTKNYSPTYLTNQAMHCFPWYLCVCDCLFLYFCNCLCQQHCNCTGTQKVRPSPSVSARLLPEKRRILRDWGGSALLPSSRWSGVQKKTKLASFSPSFGSFFERNHPFGG